MGVRITNRLWRVWAKALGDKAGNTDKEADAVALARSVIVLINLVCAIFITANIIHKW
tara:strand:+ start:1633 stop:1806 length:174 start_codon:yes stop_codon:yes gene_type:complete